MNPADDARRSRAKQAFQTAVGTLALAASVGYTLAGQSEPGHERLTAFIDARIIDGTEGPVIERGTLVVRDGRVEAVGPIDLVTVPDGARRLDSRGRTVLAGLINTHGHVGSTVGLKADPAFYTRGHVLAQLGLYARYGVTTVFSLGGDGEAGFAVRSEQTSPALTRARVFLAGPVITDDDPDEARATVNRIAASNPDLIKIRVDDNLGRTRKMPEATYRAIIEQAHTHGLRVAAHIFYLADAKPLLEAGADFIAHSVRDTTVDTELIDLLKTRDVCYCPTLMREVSAFVYESTPPFFADPFFLRDADTTVIEQLSNPERQRSVRQSERSQTYKNALGLASRNLKTLADAGVRIAMGTDTGLPGRFQGYFEHFELERMVEAGLTPHQVLDSATGVAAQCMGVTGVGTLEPGHWADFLVLAANPLDAFATLGRLNRSGGGKRGAGQR